MLRRATIMRPHIVTNTIAPILVCPILLLAFLPAVAQNIDRAGLESMLLRAKAASSVSQIASPFVMDVSFMNATPSGKQKGDYHLFYVARDRYRIDIHHPSFHQKLIRNGGKQWDQRSTALVPFRIRQLGALLGVNTELRSNEKIRKISQGTIAGAPVTCFLLRAAVASREICVDTGQGLLRKLSESALGNSAVLEYADYVGFGGKLFPQKIRFSQNDRTVIEADVKLTLLKGIASDVFLPPAEVEPWPVCDELEPEKRIHGLMPQAVAPDMTVRYIVTPKGKIAGLIIIPTTGTNLDTDLGRVNTNP
jgi:hypothetical protein